MTRRNVVVYVAGPVRATSICCLLYDAYGKPVGQTDCWQVEQNIRRAEELAWRVWEAGFTALCPHTNTRFYQNSLPDDTWLAGDLELLRRCDAVLLTLDWMRSSGARAERDFAINEGVSVFTTVEDLIIAYERGDFPV
jgi:nucleoside 2-deoxyribosyltransferase